MEELFALLRRDRSAAAARGADAGPRGRRTGRRAGGARLRQLRPDPPGGRPARDLRRSARGRNSRRACRPANRMSGRGMRCSSRPQTASLPPIPATPAPDAPATAPEAGARQQSSAQCDRGGARRFAPVLARTGAAARCGRGGVPVARPGSAPGARQSPGEGNRSGRQGSAASRRAPLPCSARRTPRPRTASRRSRCCATAAISPPAACSRACAQQQPEAVASAAQCRRRRDRQPAAAVEHRPESLLRSEPRLGAAAGGGRSGDHVRRHGGHQHGAWRDGHDRRLYDLRRAAGDAAVPAGILRRQSARRGAGGLPRRRPDRHRDRAQPDPLALRPAARDAARDLGPVAGVAAGGALDLRRQQPRRRYAGLDERRHRISAG